MPQFIIPDLLKILSSILQQSTRHKDSNDMYLYIQVYSSTCICIRRMNMYIYTYAPSYII